MHLNLTLLFMYIENIRGTNYNKRSKGRGNSNQDLNSANRGTGSSQERSMVGVEYKVHVPSDLDRPDEKGIKEDIDLKIAKKRQRVIN